MCSTARWPTSIHPCSCFLEFVSDFLSPTFQLMPDYSMPFGNLPNIPAEGFSHDTEVPLYFFHLFIARESNV